MNLKQVRFDYLVSFGCIMLLAYFAWHAWYGPRNHGYVALLESKTTALRAIADNLERRKAALVHQVNSMRPESVDPDMLEELARESLGWATTNELIVKTATE